jgi:hypothetical protein
MNDGTSNVTKMGLPAVESGGLGGALRGLV